MNKNETILNVKNLSKKEFMERFNDEKLYSYLKNSKEGYIEVTKVSDNPGYLDNNESRKGDTAAFGVGLRCYMEDADNWFCTSVITDIDWNNNIFTTLNSKYKFKFYEHKDKETK